MTEEEAWKKQAEANAWMARHREYVADRQRQVEDDAMRRAIAYAEDVEREHTRARRSRGAIAGWEKRRARERQQRRVLPPYPFPPKWAPLLQGDA